MASPPEFQRLSRLAPLADVFARITALAAPVAPRSVAVADAAGKVLAADVAVDAALPPRATALRDGWAVASDAVSDAGSYAPAVLDPAPVFVSVGDPLPAGMDAVLPREAVIVRGGLVQAVAGATPGEGVLTAGADANVQRALRRKGERLRDTDIAVLRAANIAQVQVREPSIRVVCATDIDAAHDFVGPLIARAIEAGGGVALRDARSGGEALEHALTRNDGADAIIAIGGTGEGPRDASVGTLARVGRLDIHGVGLRPGESAALGAVGTRPVLLLPGRLDAALAVWLIVGTRLLARLTGGTELRPSHTATLARKVASTIGLAEVVPVGACEGGVEPLASGYFPLQALARAEGWIMVAPESEGYPAGASVEVMPFP